MKKKDTFRAVLQLIHKVSPGLLPLMMVSRMISSAIPFVNIIFSSLIVDALVSGKSLEIIYPYVLWMVFLSAGFVILHQGLEKLVNIRTYCLDAGVWNEIAKKALVMDYELLEKRDTMELITKAKEGMQSYGSLQNFCQAFARLIGIVVDMIYSVILIVPVILPAAAGSGSGLFRFFNSAAVPFIILVILILQLVLLYRINRTSGKLQKENFEHNVEGNTVLGVYMDPLVQYREGKDIRMSHLHIPYVNRYRQGAGKVHKTMSSLHRKVEKMEAVNTLAAMLFSLVCYIYVGVKALLGMVTVGSVVKYVSAFTKFSVSLSGVVDLYVSLKIISEYLICFVNFMEIENQKYDGTLPIEKRDDNEYEFEFRDVSFSYPNSEKPVLNHISFKIRIGKKMALVGPNGAGKTTFIKLLCRLYDPTEGEILLNGIDIRYYDYQEYMQIFSVVFQDFKLFSFSIAENVAASKEYDEERVRDCLNKAGFSKRLAGLEGNIDTNLYQLEEDGVEISGGEAQKIAIARALYKDSPLVILDEPTSALDPESEYEIYRSFDELVEEKTAIYISHRMSSCRFCNQILVFDQGRIVQQGSHDELVEDRQGLYYQMWCAQAEYYQ